MIDLRKLDHWRIRGDAAMAVYGWEGDETCGAFLIPSPIDRGPMVIIASSEGGWDHISVSRRNRCPNWTEMEHVMKLVALPDETWVQFHVPASDHVNVHPHCLHWWRCQMETFPRPPGVFV